MIKLVTLVTIPGMVDRSVNNYKVVTLVNITGMDDCSVSNCQVGYTDSYNEHDWLFCKEL